MKRIFLAPVAVLAGCATGVGYVAPSAPSNVAVLTVAAIDATEHPLVTGISSIGDMVYFSPPKPKTVFLAPGMHAIGFNCTQSVSTGGAPVVVHKFVAGESYYIGCRGNIAVVSVGPGEGPN